MNNKKKILVILIAIFLCSGMFFIAEIIKYSQGSKVGTTIESEVKDSESELSNNENSSDDKKASDSSGDETVSDDTGIKQDDNQKSQSTQQTNTQQEPKQIEPKEQVKRLPKGSKIIVKNSITGSTILSVNISPDNKSVGEATTRALDSNGVDYKATGFGPAMYIASIAGLSEKAEGPTSGWVYYIQKGGTGSFTKPGVSCGSYKLQEGDVVLWKYVKEGA